MNEHIYETKTEYSSNTIVNKTVLEKLVGQSSITKGDLVYDIGAGSGIISEILLKKDARVIAIEKNRELYQKCKHKLIGQDRFELYLDDFLIYEFPPVEIYKVFSNIPFNYTSDIVNKLLYNSNPPEDCYLILQKEAAEKYAGIPRDTLVSLLIKPIYWIDILYHFKRSDFYPVPSVDVTLLQVEKRKARLIPKQYYDLYKDFVIYCREGGKQTVKRALKQLFTYSQLKQLTTLLTIDFQSRPTDLEFRQYLALFQFYLDLNLKNTGHLVQGAERKLHKQQANRIKIHRTIKRRRKPDSTP